MRPPNTWPRRCWIRNGISSPHPRRRLPLMWRRLKRLRCARTTLISRLCRRGIIRIISRTFSPVVTRPGITPTCGARCWLVTRASGCTITAVSREPTVTTCATRCCHAAAARTRRPSSGISTAAIPISGRCWSTVDLRRTNLKRWIRAMRGQSPAHDPGLTLSGQPVRRMRRTHARPSVPRAKTKAFLHRRRGTSLCLGGAALFGTGGTAADGSSAIDHQVLPGDVAAGRRAEKHHRAGHVVGLSEPAQGGDIFRPPGDLRVLPQRSGEVGLDETGRDTVDSDIVRAELDGEIAGELEISRLGDAVGTQKRRSLQAAHGRDDDDRAVPAGYHFRGDELDQ